MVKISEQVSQVRSSWEENCSLPDQSDLVADLTSVDRGFFRNRQEEVRGTLLLTARWLGEKGPQGKHRDALEGKNAQVGQLLTHYAPSFDNWYFGEDTYSEYDYEGCGTDYEQVSDARWQRFARTFEVRLQEYVKRKEWDQMSDPIKGSVVYVIGSTKGTPVCKIGKSTDPESRFGSIQVGFPWELNVYRLFRAKGERFEHRIHSLLESEHIRGEWFRFTEKVKSLVEPRHAVPLSEFSITDWF